MTRTYTIGRYLDPNGTGEQSASPSWVLCAVRFKHRDTFSREKLESQSLDGSDAASEKKPLIIRTDCIQLQVSKGKRSSGGNLVARLKSGNINYLAELNPGDWLFAWMVNSPEAEQAIVDALTTQKTCNGFMSGLKFMGRVYSVQKVMSQDERGTKQVSYQLQGNSFSEFDSSIFWDPYLARKQDFFTTWAGDLGMVIQNFTTKEGVDINGVIPSFLEVLFGRGISRKAQNLAGDARTQIVTGLTAGTGDAPFAYVVPSSVGKILGKASRSKTSGVLAYADILTSTFGIQKYGENLNESNTEESNLGKIFAPSSFKPLYGKFSAVPPSLAGVSIWSILNTYLSPVINEMYTCMRADHRGAILPTLVIRQLPFSSDEAVGGVNLTPGMNVESNSRERTRFLDLPRWRVPTSLVFGYNFSRSDAMRCNFVHLLGQTQAQVAHDNIQQQLMLSPPIRDDQDIRRNGLRMESQVIPCGLHDATFGPSAWRDIRSDIVIGGHMLLSGTIDMELVQEPICVGDNFEYEGVVFHIEEVSHTCMATPDGKRHGATSLQLSYGVRSDDDAYIRLPDISDTGLSRYAALDPWDSTLNDPGFTTDSGNSQEGALAVDTSQMDRPVEAPSTVGEPTVSDSEFESEFRIDDE